MDEKMKKKNFGIIELLLGIFLLILALGVGFFISFLVFLFEGYLGKTIFEMYFYPIPLKTAMGVVFLSSFMLTDVYIKIGNVKKLIEDGKNQPNETKKEKEQRLLKKYFDENESLWTPIKQMFTTIFTVQFANIIILFLAWLCHFFV